MKLVEKVFKRKYDGTKKDVNCYYITSPFGMRTLNGKTKQHNGCDYGTHKNNWKLYAVEDGEVISVSKATVGGNTIEIYYPRLGVYTVFAHCDKIFSKKGDKVDNNTNVANVGMTGTGVTGIHLHLGVKDKNKKYIDPEKYDYQDKTIFRGGERDTTKDQVQIISESLNVRKEGNSKSEILGQVEKDKYYEIFGMKDGWYLIDKGWVSGNYTQFYAKTNDKEEQIIQLKQQIEYLQNETNRLKTENQTLNDKITKLNLLNAGLEGIISELEERYKQEQARIHKIYKITKTARYIITLQDKDELIILR